MEALIGVLELFRDVGQLLDLLRGVHVKERRIAARGGEGWSCCHHEPMEERKPFLTTKLPHLHTATWAAARLRHAL